MSRELRKTAPPKVRAWGGAPMHSLHWGGAARAAPMGKARELALGTIVASAYLLSGCDSCGSEKPYTPFGVASSIASVASTPAPVASTPPPDAGAPEPRKAVLTPVGAREFTAGAVKLTAPDGRDFEQILSADLDGD